MDEVSCNLKMDTSGKTPSALEVQSVIRQIEYNVYKKHEHKHNSREYTKELRALKKDILQNNKHQQKNQTVWKTFEEMR